MENDKEMMSEYLRRIQQYEQRLMGFGRHMNTVIFADSTINFFVTIPTEDGKHFLPEIDVSFRPTDLYCWWTAEDNEKSMQTLKEAVERIEAEAE